MLLWLLEPLESSIHPWNWLNISIYVGINGVPLTSPLPSRFSSIDSVVILLQIVSCTKSGPGSKFRWVGYDNLSLLLSLSLSLPLTRRLVRIGT
ncbi:hypothetical protein TorRG33x02_108170, partial [Trema orientale]